MFYLNRWLKMNYVVFASLFRQIPTNPIYEPVILSIVAGSQSAPTSTPPHPVGSGLLSDILSWSPTGCSETEGIRDATQATAKRHQAPLQSLSDYTRYFDPSPSPTPPSLGLLWLGYSPADTGDLTLSIWPSLLPELVLIRPEDTVPNIIIVTVDIWHRGFFFCAFQNKWRKVKGKLKYLLLKITLEWKLQDYK